MSIRKITFVLAGLLIAAGCGSSSTPEPLGDQHVIETGRDFEALDALSDQDLIESAKTDCPVIDRYGPEGFERLSQNIEQIHDDPEVVVAMHTLLAAAVRAYCPEHYDDLQDWAEVD